MSTEGITVSGDWGGEPQKPAQEAAEAPEIAETEAEAVAEAEEEAPAAAEEPEAANDDEDDDHPSRKKPAHKRIAELTKARREAERERDEMRAELAKLKTGATNDNAAPDLSDLKEPNADDFEFGMADPQYIAALTEYKVESRLRQREAEQAQNAEKQRITQMATELDSQWQAKAAEGAKKYQDFDEVVLESAAANEWPCPPLVAMAIAASDQGADIAYHLAKNTAEATKLAKLAQSDPFEAIRQFGRLEARFENSANDNAKVDRKVTKAPEPAKERVRGSSGQFKAPADTSSLADFKAAYGKELGLR
jgi:hypothetical protein